MDEIQHKFVKVGALNLHIAEIGTGPNVVIFLHGFPEIWYSWRHQMIALADAGFRAIAPDYRGYGLSDPPPQPHKATFSHLLSDLLGILDSLSLSKVFLVGKDFGASPAYLFSIFHPERVLGIVTLGVPYVPPGPSTYDKYFPEGFYMLRWREPGRAEADFGRFDVKTVVKNVYILFSSSELPIANENQEIMDLVEPSTPLPPWLTEEDLASYGALYEKSGFQTALQIPYRSIGENFDLPDPLLKVPTLLIMGGKDYVLKFPGFEDLTKGEKAKQFALNLEITFIPEGTHFVQEQFPAQEPGRAEADFGRFDVKTVVKNVYILFSSSELPIANENQEIMDLVEPSTPLPPWLTEEDLATYGALYEKSGFQTVLQIPYRAFGESFDLPDPVLKVPTLLIMGGKDYVLKFPGFEDLTKGEKAKQFAPNLEITYIPEGTHFIQEQFPLQVNQLLLAFLAKHT